MSYWVLLRCHYCQNERFFDYAFHETFNEGGRNQSGEVFMRIIITWVVSVNNYRKTFFTPKGMKQKILKKKQISKHRPDKCKTISMEFIIEISKLLCTPATQHPLNNFTIFYGILYMRRKYCNMPVITSIRLTFTWYFFFRWNFFIVFTFYFFTINVLR